MVYSSTFELQENDVCYFVGAGEDISFDCVIARKYSCEIHIFDPTPRAVAHFSKLSEAVKADSKFPINNSETDFYDISNDDFQKISFHPWGLSDKDGEQKFYYPKNPEHVSCSMVNLQDTESFFIAQCSSLPVICEKLGHKQIKFMKIDIEGEEGFVIQDMVRRNLLPELLCVEFDELQPAFVSKDRYENVCRSIDALLSAGMQFIYMEGANATFLKIHRG